MVNSKRKEAQVDQKQDSTTKPVTYVYGIYDMRKKEWMPGTYGAEEVRRTIDFKGSVSEIAKSGVLLKKRYKVVIVEERRREKEKFAEEWDAARMRLLGTRKR